MQKIICSIILLSVLTILLVHISILNNRDKKGVEAVANLASTQEEFIIENSSNIKLALILKNTNLAFVFCNESGTVFHVDGSFLDITKYELRNVIGKKPYQFIPEPFRQMHTKLGDRWVGSQPPRKITVVTSQQGGGIVAADGSFIPGDVLIQKIQPVNSTFHLIMIFIPEDYKTYRGKPIESK